MLADKDIAETISPLRELIDSWHIAPIEISRAATLDHLSQAFRYNNLMNVSQYDSIASAYRQLCAQIGQDDRIIAFGSFHVVAKILELGV